MQLSSPSFQPNGPIPDQYTCEGENASPTIEWSGVPAGTKSMALIVDDPDAPDPKAPQKTFVHWVVYGLPPNAGRLPDHATAQALPEGAKMGLNDFKKSQWGGPCPPVGRHRYFFKLYALDTKLGNLKSATKQQLLEAMKGHILEEAQLVGTFEKHRH